MLENSLVRGATADRPFLFLQLIRNSGNRSGATLNWSDARGDHGTAINIELFDLGIRAQTGDDLLNNLFAHLGVQFIARLRASSVDFLLPTIFVP